MDHLNRLGDKSDGECRAIIASSISLYYRVLVKPSLSDFTWNSTATDALA